MYSEPQPAYQFAANALPYCVTTTLDSTCSLCFFHGLLVTACTLMWFVAPQHHLLKLCANEKAKLFA